MSFALCRKRSLLALLAAAALCPRTPAGCPSDQAGEADPAATIPLGGPLSERPKLTADWFGCRTALQDGGVTLDAGTTQYYQGVASGGLRQEFPYGGRNDYFLNLDGEKLGLWRGLTATVHAESRYGESANFLTGALSPVNELLAVPEFAGYALGLTAVRLNQAVGENALVYAGKINTFDDIRQPLTGAGPRDGFWNTSLIFNPIYARTLPFSTYGAGLALLADDQAVLALAVFDTNNTPTVTGFDTFFDNGVTIFAQLNLPTRFFGLPGHQGVSGTYSSGRYTSLTPSPYLDPIQGLFVQPEAKTGSWCLSYNFDQALHADPGDPARVWGVFGHLGLADDNPNPIRYSVGVGLSGASPLRGRPRDTFGVGYYFLGVSDPLKQFAGPAVPLRNEQGVDLYYNAAVTPWLHVTPDVQVVEPLLRQADTALLFGLRARLDF
ncbi:MAG: carbohydrate porin [Gemmataceae bacterium]